MVKRTWLLHSAGMAVAAAVGLASRTDAVARFSPFLAAHAGDAMWAAAVFFLAGLIAPGASTVRLATFAMAVAIAVELSQLLHTGWLDAMRATRIGELVLGHGFLWIDFARYAAGIALAMLVRTAAIRGCTSPRVSVNGSDEDRL